MKNMLADEPYVKITKLDLADFIVWGTWYSKEVCGLILSRVAHLDTLSREQLQYNEL